MKILLTLIALSFSCSAQQSDHYAIISKFEASGQQFSRETIPTKDSQELTTILFRHASIAFIWDGMTIYVDPISEYADYSQLPKADLILLTHEHGDHLDPTAIDALWKEGTTVISSANVAGIYTKAQAMKPGQNRELGNGVKIEAVPAYNVSPHQLQYHPKERGDNGYILNLGSTRVYVSGDTEPIEEMKQFGEIDLMFLPVNQPYTMTLEQAVQAARTIGAPIFIPYHTGGANVEALVQMLSDTPSISVRIHPL